MSQPRDLDRLCLPVCLGLLALVFAASTLGGMMAAQDSFMSYEFFNFSLSNLVKDNELPQWLPFVVYGVPAEPFALAFLGPFQLLALLAGWALRLHAAWNLFVLSVFLEAVVFVTGVHFLARELYRTRTGRRAATLAAVFFLTWQTQIFWAHKLVLYAPLLLLLSLRFHRTGDLAVFFQGVLVFFLSLWGNLAYMAPMLALIILVFNLALAGFTRRLPRPQAATLAVPRTLAYAGLSLGLGGALAWTLRHAFDGLVVYAPGRDRETFSVSRDVFLDYGGSGVEKLHDFALGSTVHYPEFLFYLGLAATVLLVYAAWKVRSPLFRAVLATGAFVLLLSLGRAGLVAYAAYSFPLADQFRHLKYLLPLARFLLLLAAVYGLDRLAAEPPDRRTVRDLTLVLAGVVACFAALRWLAFPNHTRLASATWLPEIFLALLGGLLALGWQRPGTLARGLPALFCLEAVAVYAAFVFVLQRPMITPQGLPPGFPMRQTHAIDFVPAREMAPSSSRWQAARIIANKGPGSLASQNILTSNFVETDLCLPVLRVDYATQAVHGYFAALLPQLATAAKPWVELAGDGSQLFTNRQVREACGCAAPKLAFEGGEWGGDLSGGVAFFSANRLRFVADNPSGEPRRAVYADSFHPGWQGTVDGNPVPVQVMNGAFKGLEIPPGRHEAEFRFHDPARDLGRFGLAVAGLAGLAGIFAGREAAPGRGPGAGREAAGGAGPDRGREADRDADRAENREGRGDVSARNRTPEKPGPTRPARRKGKSGRV